MGCSVAILFFSPLLLFLNIQYRFTPDPKAIKTVISFIFRLGYKNALREMLVFTCLTFISSI